MRSKLCGASVLQDFVRIRTDLRFNTRTWAFACYFEVVILKALQKQEQQLEEEGQEESGDSFRSLSVTLESKGEEEEEMKNRMVDPNREWEESLVYEEESLVDEEERELNMMKDWVNMCQIR